MARLISPDWQGHWYGVPREMQRGARGLGWMFPLPMPPEPANGIDIDYHTPPVEVACPKCSENGLLFLVAGFVAGLALGAGRRKF
jgi:hypothetical protein